MKIYPCSAQDKPAILAILNEAIVNTTALYDYHPRTPEMMDSWFEAKQKNNYPVIGAFRENELLGFATYGQFRNWPAYKYSVEHSVYVKDSARGKGIGTHLLQDLIQKAIAQDYHTLIGGIDAANESSIRLHEKLGFHHAGTIRHAGYKFGRWLDLAFYQLILDTPAHPVEG